MVARLAAARRRRGAGPRRRLAGRRVRGARGGRDARSLHLRSGRRQRQVRAYRSGPRLGPGDLGRAHARLASAPRAALALRRHARGPACGFPGQRARPPGQPAPHGHDRARRLVRLAGLLAGGYARPASPRRGRDDRARRARSRGCIWRPRAGALLHPLRRSARPRRHRRALRHPLGAERAGQLSRRGRGANPRRSPGDAVPAARVGPRRRVGPHRGGVGPQPGAHRLGRCGRRGRPRRLGERGGPGPGCRPGAVWVLPAARSRRSRSSAATGARLIPRHEPRPPGARRCSRLRSGRRSLAAGPRRYPARRAARRPGPSHPRQRRGQLRRARLDEQGGPGRIGNLELHLLYDSGALGLALALAGLAVIARGAVGALRRAPVAGPDRAVILGLLAAGAALLVAYQATEGTWLAYTWIYAGLLARAGAAPAPATSRIGDRRVRAGRRRGGFGGA